MKLRKSFALLILLAVFCFCPMTKAHAATDNYVMDRGWSSLDTAVKVNGYQIKATATNLYSRKSSSSSWKKIASNSNGITCFTSNGSTIYYASSTYNYNSQSGSSKIYSVSVTGANKTLVKTVSKKRVYRIYRYKNKLYLTESTGKVDASLYTLDLTSKTHKKYASNYFMDGAKGNRAMITPMMYYKWTQPLYSLSLTSKSRTKISSYCYAHYISGSYVYYAAYTSDTYAAYEPGYFYVRRCKLDGTDKKALTSKLNGQVTKITASKVTYTRNGKTYTKSY